MAAASTATSTRGGGGRTSWMGRGNGWNGGGGRGGGGFGRGRGGGGGGRGSGGLEPGGMIPNGISGHSSRFPDYEEEKQLCTRFLTQFRGAQGGIKYHELMEMCAQRECREVVVELDDLEAYAQQVEEAGEAAEPFRALLQSVEQNTMRYVHMFQEAIDQHIPRGGLLYDTDDVLDVLRLYRVQRALAAASSSSSSSLSSADELGMPAALLRRYELRIVPRSAARSLAMRQIRARHIGQLVTVRGIVTRVTDVKPLVVVATYTCDMCGCEAFQEVPSSHFTPLEQCQSSLCNGSGGTLHMQTRGSKFVKYQQIRLQECAEEVPVGHIPCMLTVHLQGELTRACVPGDLASVAGVFLPLPTSTWKALKLGLQSETYVEAMEAVVQKKKPAVVDHALGALSEPTASRRRVQLLRQECGGSLYERLAASIAPEIYGHADVKKALLLLMVGGVPRALADGMKIRGDLHVCLMGDPGVAKSQLLKHIAAISPRGVYTSGKGSSGVGLTASVLRDAVTKEMVLEGGSLVLADMGVCCIDEFDKMDEYDRTAIHEVMEQQTISIAKAGIMTTLNARSAVLAAANPAYGRYNPRKSPEENINLPAALLSRFDLMFLILDRAQFAEDIALARHVTTVHRTGKHPPRTESPLPPAAIREAVAEAKRHVPHVPLALQAYISEAYVQMRSKVGGSLVTARTLLAVLRLSQALARLRLDDVVARADVDEAIRLIYMSKASLEKNSAERSEGPVSGVFNILAEARRTLHVDSIALPDILPQILARGYTQTHLEEALQVYSDCCVWVVDGDWVHFAH